MLRQDFPGFYLTTWRTGAEFDVKTFVSVLDFMLYPGVKRRDRKGIQPAPRVPKATEYLRGTPWHTDY